MWIHCLQRRPNIKITLDESLVCAGILQKRNIIIGTMYVCHGKAYADHHKPRPRWTMQGTHPANMRRWPNDGQTVNQPWVNRGMIWEIKGNQKEFYLVAPFHEKMP